MSLVHSFVADGFFSFIVNQEMVTEEHEAPTGAETSDAEEKDGAVAEDTQVVEATNAVVDTVVETVTQTTTVVTEIVREQATFDLNVGQALEVSGGEPEGEEIPVPEQEERGDPDVPMDAEDAQGESGDYQEEVAEAMPEEEVAEAEEGDEDGDADGGEPLSEEESESEEDEEAEEDVGEVEDEDDTRDDDDADDDTEPSMRAKIWDFLTT